MSKVINIQYSINDDQCNMAFEPRNKLSVFKSVLKLTQKLNPDLYDIFYKRKLISNREDSTISEIIGPDQRPHFSFVKKKLEHTFKNSIKPATPRLMSKVIVENFPSRNEFHELVEGFQKEIKHSDIQNEFQIEHKQSCIEIKFYDDKLALEFIKFINFQKFCNHLYSNVKSKLIYEEGDPSFFQKQAKYLKKVHSYDKIHLKHMDHSTNLNLSGRQSVNSSVIEGKIRIKQLLQDESFLKKYYGNSSLVRISSPYVSDEDKRIEEAKKSKQKWLVKDGFKLFNKFRPKEIKNYVNLTKYSPPNKGFRDIKKEKWLGNQDFFVV